MGSPLYLLFFLALLTDIKVSTSGFKARVTVPLYNIGTSGSIVVCISPLTSLMMNQYAKFKPKGIRTEFVCEAQSNEISTHRVIIGEIQLVYISPESAICNYEYRNIFLSSPYNNHLVAIAVDEAYCVKT